jgi:hypothetical protein
MRGEMHYGVDTVFAKYSADQCHVASVADQQIAEQHRLGKSCGKIVKHDNSFTCFTELPNNVAANIPGATGYEDSFLFHWLAAILLSGFWLVEFNAAH